MQEFVVPFENLRRDLKIIAADLDDALAKLCMSIEDIAKRGDIRTGDPKAVKEREGEEIRQ